MTDKKRSKVVYEAHLSESDLRKGIVSGKYLIGKLHIPMRYAMDRAYVQNIDLYPRGMDICIENRKNRNRAFENDIVAVEIYDWVHKEPNTTKEAESDDTVENETCFTDGWHPVEESDDSPSTNSKLNFGPLAKTCIEYEMPPVDGWEESMQPIGKIVAIINQQPQLIIGKVQPESDTSKVSFFKIIPYNAKLPISIVFCRDIPHKILSDINEHLLLVKSVPSKWKEENNYAPAKFVKSLGFTGSVQAESAAILSAQGVRDEPFSDAVMDSIVKEKGVPPSGKTCDGRLDLRDKEFICSIDPSTARDLDDALSIRKLKNGHYKVGVHIADVTAYVPEMSECDIEAQMRATSCYITERVIPMLPPTLSEDKCSLNTSEDKFAFSIMWELDKYGVIVPETEWIGKTIIRNNCQLAYENAQSVIEDKVEEDEKLQSLEADKRSKVISSVRALWSLAKQIRQRRFEGGSINLDFPKLSFVTTDNDSSLAPIGFYIGKLKEANFLIEEFMLLANRRVAEKIYKFLPYKALVRKHDPPQQQSLKFFKTFMSEMGIDFEIHSIEAFARSLRNVQADEKVCAKICALLLRAMKRAEYCMCGGPRECTRHFALNMHLYTHFTSPIRRYADLHVHRLLAKVLAYESALKNGEAPEEMDDIALPSVDCSHLNERAQRAQDASERSRDLFVCLYLESIRKVALESDVPTHPYKTASACMVKLMLRKKLVVLYIPELTCYIDIKLDDRRQLWKLAKISEAETSIMVDWADVENVNAKLDKDIDNLEKLMKAMKVEKGKDKEEVEDERLPKIKLLDELTVSLVVGAAFPMKLHAIIHPPALQEKNLPLKLLDAMRH